jgi:chromosome segregation ATPase
MTDEYTMSRFVNTEEMYSTMKREIESLRTQLGVRTERVSKLEKDWGKERAAANLLARACEERAAEIESLRTQLRVQIERVSFLERRLVEAEAGIVDTLRGLRLENRRGEYRLPRGAVPSKTNFCGILSIKGEEI